MIDYIDSNDFLPGILKENIDTNDSENTNEKLSIYELNSCGYRCPEFNKIDLKESIFLFGCSCTFGVKLKIEETIAYKLHQKTKRPVINMAIPGSSIQFNVYNQFKLAHQEENPYAVINLWTSLNRLPYFKNSEAVIHLGPWVNKQNSDRYEILLTSGWLQNSKHSISVDKFFVKNTRFLWKNTKHIEGSVFEGTAKTLNTKYFTLLDMVDKHGHPGPKSTENIAEYLANQIFLLDKDT